MMHQKIDRIINNGIDPDATPNGHLVGVSPELWRDGNELSREDGVNSKRVQQSRDMHSPSRDLTRPCVDDRLLHG